MSDKSKLDNFAYQGAKKPEIGILAEDMKVDINATG